jgi:hypothetical protein
MAEEDFPISRSDERITPPESDKVIEDVGTAALEGSVSEPTEIPSDEAPSIESGAGAAGEEAVEVDDPPTEDDEVSAESAGGTPHTGTTGSPASHEEASRIVHEIMGRSKDDLLKEYLGRGGMGDENIDKVIGLLKPVQLYLKKLEDLGMPKTKREAAHKILMNEVGQERIAHLAKLGAGKEKSLSELLNKQFIHVLVPELRGLGLSDEEIMKIITTGRDRSKLEREVLKKHIGEASAEYVLGAETASMAPADVATEADRLGIPLRTLYEIKVALSEAAWQDVIDYAEALQRSEKLRGHFKYLHGIEVEPKLTVETDAERLERLSRTPLKQINETEPDAWEGEKSRRIEQRRAEITRMVEKFRDYIPLDELPIPDDVEPLPDMQVPDDLLGAYGLWRFLLVKSLEERIADPKEFSSVRGEVKKAGGRVPVIKQVKLGLLSIRILENEKKHPDTRRNYGPSGLGYRRFKKIYRALEDFDIDVGNAKSALSRTRNTNYTTDGQQTPRRELAENILKIKEDMIAHRRGRLHLHMPEYSDPSAETDEEPETLAP